MTTAGPRPRAGAGARYGGVLGSVLTDCAVVECWGQLEQFDSHPAEIATVSLSGSKRRREFLTGRTLARVALRALGAEPGPLLKRPDRTPAWPEGFVGSLTHTEGYVAAAVSPRGNHRAIGIDAEQVGAVTRGLWPALFTPAERRWIERGAGLRAAEAATLLFGVKEAYFKCQFPVTTAWLDFRQVEARQRGDGFEVVVSPEAGVDVMRDLTCGWRIAHGIVIVAFSLPP